jgi:hypothetical protein
MHLHTDITDAADGDLLICFSGEKEKEIESEENNMQIKRQCRQRRQPYGMESASDSC